MHTRQPPATEDELVHACEELFNEVGPDTPEEIDDVLRATGHDPEAIAARMQAAAERALARARGAEDENPSGRRA